MKKAVSRILTCGLLFGLALQLLGPPSGYPKASSTSSGSGLPYSAEWRITGPTGGDVRALVVDPEDPNRFYFGTLDGQLYTSGWWPELATVDEFQSAAIVCRSHHCRPAQLKGFV